MSRLDKQKNRLKKLPKDYTYTEAKTLLSQLGYQEFTKGKTSGLRVKFYRALDQSVILLHKPHPSDIMSVASVKDIVVQLNRTGDL